MSCDVGESGEEAGEDDEGCTEAQQTGVAPCNVAGREANAEGAVCAVGEGVQAQVWVSPNVAEVEGSEESVEVAEHGD